MSRRSAGRTFRGLRAAAAGVMAAWVAQPAARAASAYEKLIAPLFQARCAECHGEEKQKAHLALHTWAGLAKGSDAGPVFVAGKPDESALIERLKLPASDEEHMPPADRPQPAAEEIALLAHWISRGASPTASVAELGLPAPLARAAAALPAKLAALAGPRRGADPLWAPDAAAVTAARAPLAAAVAGLQRRFPGALSYESRTSAALHFTAAGLGRAFGDAELAALAPLRDQIVVLDLSGSGVTDNAAGVIGDFPRLRVFRAGSTRVGDAVAARLAALPELASVSLADTAVTAASVGAFTRLRSLRALRVAGTAAEAAARAANLPVGPSAADLIPPVAIGVEAKAP